MKEKVILGIDPGTTVMGYGLIKSTGKNMEMITFGFIQLNKYKDHMLKLQHIFTRSLQLIETYKPDELSIEAPFYGKNVQSMLKLGRAQGISIAAALYRGIPIFEYAPKRIKQAITGNGNASKEQVAAMLVRLLHIEMPEYLDATDGLAAAVAHHFQGDKINSSEGKAYSSWDTFIKQNPGRIK
ncbi:crossover junction endodeoxyribonuclease RuvC [Bacteroidota bacterium]